MHLIKRLFPRLSQRGVENILLLVLGLVLYSQGISSLPAKLHHFEEWIDRQLPLLAQGWRVLWAEYSQLAPNDTNAAVRSPAWLFIIAFSNLFFSDALLAHRVPSVFLTALTPLIMAEITRRFYRKDMALFVGLVCLGSQHLMFLGRIAGYVAPTTTLLAFIMLCAMRIGWEGSRRAWIPFTLSMLLVPMAYSTVRYMSLMGFLIIGVALLRSGAFRKRHLLPALVCGGILVGYLSIFVRESISFTFVEFFGARGEQYLITHQSVGGGAQSETTLVSRLIGAAAKTVPDNLAKVLPTYLEGRRFFNWHYQALNHTMHKVLVYLFFCGFGVAAFLSWRKPRYLVIVLWSLLAWIPLLFTTGLTNNRMLVGMPADMFLITLAAMVVHDAIRWMVGERFKIVPKALMLGVIGYFIYFSYYRLIFDCLKFCHL